jgi:WD40 repeat protein
VGSENKVYLWDLPTGSESTLRGHLYAVTALALSPDGRTLATGGDDPAIKLWNMSGRQEVARLDGAPLGSWSLAFSPDGTVLAAGGSDGVLRLWRAATRERPGARQGEAAPRPSK